MEENWDIYFSNDDDQISSIIVDLGIMQKLPISGLPILMLVKMSLLNPDEDGLYTEEEAETLDKIDKALFDQMVTNLGGMYAARITVGGRQEYYFYLKEGIDLLPPQ